MRITQDMLTALNARSSLNFMTKQRVMDLVKRNNGQFASEHTTGEIASFKICPTVLGLDTP